MSIKEVAHGGEVKNEQAESYRGHRERNKKLSYEKNYGSEFKYLIKLF